jgi:hypothetical protein
MNEPRIIPPDMKLAIPTTCVSGHRFYRESGTATNCPYCLNSAVVLLQTRISKIKTLANYIISE